MDLEGVKKRLLESIGREVRERRVLKAMERVPREAFVPQESRHLAYEDVPLPIGYGQTVSQPYIVALMTQALEVGDTDRILEVGTGSGYQAAILAELAREVVSVERVESLAKRARAALLSLGYSNVDVRIAGKTIGCPQEAPYEGIVVTAASPKLLTSLLEQLAPKGRLVIPVGSVREQELMKVVKSEGGYSVVSLGNCRFVPLIGEGAWDSKHDLH